MPTTSVGMAPRVALFQVIAMSNEIALLNNYLIVGALLFGIGMVGFLSRRNMIVMFLSLEIMLQGVSLSLAAWSRFHNDFGGQMLVLFIIAVAACEAALALALILTLFARHGTLDIVDWQSLREANQPPFVDEPLTPPPAEHEEPMPHLPPAGVEPVVPREETEYRPKV
jgi:NADH-quinone oxidoreductase subunit K